jgi:hypothetical protein
LDLILHTTTPSLPKRNDSAKSKAILSQYTSVINSSALYASSTSTRLIWLVLGLRLGLKSGCAPTVKDLVSVPGAGDKSRLTLAKAF